MWKRSCAAFGSAAILGLGWGGCGATEAGQGSRRSVADGRSDSGDELREDPTHTDTEPGDRRGGNDASILPDDDAADDDAANDDAADDDAADDDAADDDSPDGSVPLPTRVVLGCLEQPLTLGGVGEVEAVQPQVVWTGRDFAVGWASNEGYRIVLTSGSSISHSLTLQPLPEASAPQLFWTGTQLELYYGLQDSIYVDTLRRDGALSVGETRYVGVGQSFRAVQIELGNVAVLTNDTLHLNGEKIAMKGYGFAAAGWNGKSFLYSNSLGHGEWTLYGLNPDGSPDPFAMQLTWSGIAGTGRAAGSDFASSADVGRHAVVVAAGGTLSLAIEGLPLFERGLLQPEADASLFFDGELYVALLANGTVDEQAANRDIGLLAFTTDGALLSQDESLTVLSNHESDERFPVGASSKPGDFAAAWVRGSELVAQHCAMTVR